MQQGLFLSLTLHIACVLAMLAGSFFSFHTRVVPDTLPSFEVVESADMLKQKPASTPPKIEPLDKPEEAESIPQQKPKQNLEGAVPDIKKPSIKNDVSDSKALNRLFDNISKEEKLNKQFDNMLKNVENVKPKRKAAQPSDKKTIKNVLDSIDNEVNGSKIGHLSATDEDLIRQQIYPNWFVPAGIKNAENIVVEIEVRLSENGEVIAAKILDESRCMSEQSIRAAAESAKRAVIMSSPIKIPPALKGTLKKFVLRFNPKDVLGQ